MSSAIWSALGRAFVLMRRISALTAGGLPTSKASRCVFVITSAFFSSAFDTWAACREESTSLEFASFVKSSDSEASMIAPANASPNERPNEPPAELTPAASLTRSSSIGASV